MGEEERRRSLRSVEVLFFFPLFLLVALLRLVSFAGFCFVLFFFFFTFRFLDLHGLRALD